MSDRHSRHDHARHSAGRHATASQSGARHSRRRFSIPFGLGAAIAGPSPLRHGPRNVTVALLASAVTAIALFATWPGNGSGGGTTQFTQSSDAYSQYSTLFSPTAKPAVTTPDPERNSVELGVQFRSQSSGYVAGLRVFRAQGETASHPGTLWGPDHTKLTSVNFPASSKAGWQYALFGKPVAIKAGSTYTASYHSSTGYAAQASYFRSTALSRGPLTALANTSTTHNGVYAYGSTASFPTSSWRGSNYWIDVLFSTSTTSAPTTPAPSTSTHTAPTSAPASTTSTPAPSTSAHTSSSAPTSKPPSSTTSSPTTSSPAPPASGTYIKPGQAGFTGDRSALTVVPDQKVPSGCTWDSGAKVLNCRSNAVLDHVYVKGAVDSYANLTITNSVIEATPSSSILVNERGGSSNNCTISHSTLVFNNGGHFPAGLSTWGTPAIADDNQCHGDYQYNDLSGTPDGIQTAAKGAIIRYNYIHNLALFGSPPNDTHNDGIQLFGCTGCDISFNYFDLGWDGIHQNACFFESDGNPGDSIKFTGNYLSGGGFAFRNIIGTNMTVTNNTFHPLANQFGQTLTSSRASFAAWSGNVTTTGATVPKPTP